MFRIEVFYSDQCPDCTELIPELEAAVCEAEFINISDSMANLRRFLAYRDRLDGYAQVRVQGYVGVPSAVRGGVEATLATDKIREWVLKSVRSC